MQDNDDGDGANNNSKLLESVSFSPTEMEKCREEINESFYLMLSHIGSVQEAMVNEFTLNVSDITKLNNLISSESKTMDAYKTALDRKDQLFFEFVKLKALPDAYKACIKEIIRRRAFGILINNEINNHLFTIFDIFRNEEISKRKKFINEYGMLPVDLVEGLTKMPGNIKISYNYSIEESLPIIDKDINIIKQSLSKELEQCINDYTTQNDNNCKWKWKCNGSLEDVERNGYHGEEKQNKVNNIDLLKEQNKWKTEKLRLETEYEEKLAELQNKLKKLENKNQDLEIEMEQYKREEFPDPPSLSQQESQGWDGINSEYIANQLSTILGASISNVNPSSLEQSRMFLSKMYNQNNANEEELMATNEVLQTDLDKLKTEMVSKENIIKKLTIENDKLLKTNNEFIDKLDKLKESSTNLRTEMEEILIKHKEELEDIGESHKDEII